MNRWIDDQGAAITTSTAVDTYAHMLGVKVRSDQGQTIKNLKPLAKVVLRT